MTTLFMRSLALVAMLAAVLMLHGCGDSAVTKAAGTYELDKPAMKAAMQAKIDRMEDQTEKFMATGILRGIDTLPSMTFVLKADGSFEATTVMMGMVDTSKGNWSVKGSTVTFRMAETGQDDPDQMTGTLTGNRIELNPPDEADAPFRLVFQRKKA